VDPIVAVTLSL
jgi:hypothetical protein